MQMLTIKIDMYEYQLFQGYCDYWLRWCYGHFNITRSKGVEPEPIIAVMFQKYFNRRVDTIKFPRLGKTLSIEYYEAKAFMEVTSICNDLPTITLRSKIDQELINWKPSLSKPSMKQWYDINDAVRDTFGEYDELKEAEYEVVNRIYNQSELL